MKKTICALLCVVMLVAMLPCLPISAGTGETPLSELNGTTVESGKTYAISDAQDLKKFATLCTSANNWCAGVTFVITADIDLNEGWTVSATAPDTVWTPITLFSGVLDGRNHTLSGFYAPEGTAYNNEVSSGIFAAVGGTGATVKNLKIVNSYFASTLYVGSVAGILPGDTNNEKLAIENVSSSAMLYSSGGMAGGIVGVANSSSWNGAKRVRLEGCSFSGSVSSASVTSINHIGGILGKNFKPIYIYDCVNSSNITVSDNTKDFYIGGIVAWANSTLVLDGCVNTGEIKFARTESNMSTAIANGHMGGLVGYSANEVDFDRCANLGNVTLEASASVTVNERCNLGGFIGFHANFMVGNFTDCLSAGTVTGAKTHCGGFIGNHRITTLNFERCIFAGNVVNNNAANWRGVFIGFMGNASAGSTSTFTDCVYNNAVNPIGCVGTPGNMNMTISMTGGTSVTATALDMGGYTAKFEEVGADKSLSSILSSDAAEKLPLTYDWTENENGWVVEQIDGEGDYIPMPRAVAVLLQIVEAPSIDTDVIVPPDSGNTDSDNTDNENTDSDNTDSENTDSENTDSGNTENETVGRLPDVFDPDLIVPGEDQNISTDSESDTESDTESEAESESESESDTDTESEVETETEAESESETEEVEESGFFGKIFGAIGNFFKSILDWFIGLFS